MTDKTLKAIQDSVKKWRKVAYKRGVEKGMDTCPLCRIFDDGWYCKGCPVAIVTGDWGCRYTPYEMWSKHLREEHSGLRRRQVQSNCAECLRLAEAELAFVMELEIAYRDYLEREA